MTSRLIDSELEQYHRKLLNDNQRPGENEYKVSIKTEYTVYPCGGKHGYLNLDRRVDFKKRGRSLKY